jgi:hypothetical protein
VLRSDSSYSLYRYLRGPITACRGGSRHLELGGWHDDSKPPLPWPRRTRVVTGGGHCIALSEFRGTPYGGTNAVTVFDLKAGTSWSLGTYSVSQFTSSQMEALSLSADCSAAWIVREATVGGPTTRQPQSQPAPADADRLSRRRGVRPEVRRVSPLSRDRLLRVALRVRLSRAPRAVTAVIGGKRTAIRTTATSTRLRLSRRDSRSFKAGRRYAITVIACADGCAVTRFRAALR